ncbi:MAG: hypothetical protein JJT96_03335 [Opitutales bacterium]|nr:hypothetical protein [Opitutales bacterium]
MIDLLRKTVLAGIGATVVTAERVEEVFNDLVARGKMTAEEAREATEKVKSESKKEFQEANKKLSSIFDDLLEKANVASAEDLHALEKRVASLEALAAKLPDMLGDAAEKGGTKGKSS